MARRVDLGEIQLACSVSGSGAPLVLLHGGEANHRMFDALTPHLAAHFTVIAYDQRDCGDTLNPARRCTLADLADDAKALLAALGHSQAHWYGTSFGGRVAQALAHRHPQVVDCLVLGSTWPLPSSLEELNAENIAQIHALRAGLPGSAETLVEFFLPRTFLDTRPELKGLFRNVLPQSERSQRRAQTIAECAPLEPGAIGAPTLLLVAELDRVVPPAVTLAMARTMPKAETVLLEGAGHAAALQMPEQVAAQIARFCLGAAARRSRAAA